MYGLMLLTLSVAPSYAPAPPDENVREIQASEFWLPLAIDGVRRETIDHLVIYISEDEGKTWRRVQEVVPRQLAVRFSSSHDGLYLFAIQIVDKDGKAEPAESKDLVPSQKVRVNTESLFLEGHKTNEELQQEIEDLQKQIAELQKQLGEVKAERNGK